MFIFIRRKVFAVLMSRLITRCLSMRTLTMSAKQLIITPGLYVTSVNTDVALTKASTIIIIIMVGARLHYCNAILHGMSKCNIQKPQRAHNSIARIVTGTRRSEHITPLPARLHWLKIAERIEYKVAVLTFRSLTTGKPGLSDQLQLCYTTV